MKGCWVLFSLVYKYMQTSFMHSNTEKHDQLKLLLGLISGRNLDTIISISFKGTIKICYISTVTDTLVKPDMIQAYSQTTTYPSFYWYSHSSNWNFFAGRNNDNNNKVIWPFAQAAWQLLNLHKRPLHTLETACHPLHLSMHWLNTVLMLVFLYKISSVKIEDPWLGKK